MTAPATEFVTFAETKTGVAYANPSTGPLVAVAKIVFWPATAALHLVRPSPNIGVPQKNLDEWTLFLDFAVAAGFGLSWAFYSSAAFLIFWLRYQFARSH